MRVIFFCLLLLCQPLAFAKQGVEVAGQSIFNISGDWQTSEGDTISLASFGGRPSLMAMIYTNCKSSCPMIVSTLKDLQAKISGKSGSQIQVVLISFDDGKDSPRVLHEYATSHQIDLKHWTLLKGTKAETRKLAGVLDVSYRQNPNKEFVHSTVITLLDSKGVIQSRQTELGVVSDTLISKALSMPTSP